MIVKREQERKEEKNKIDEKRQKHEISEKKENNGDKEKSETVKKDENQEERKIQSLFVREKEVKKVMLARKPMYLLMSHDYYLSSIASSLSLGVKRMYVQLQRRVRRRVRFR